VRKRSKKEREGKERRGRENTGKYSLQQLSRGYDIDRLFE
jgi:hypothetical protein